MNVDFGVADGWDNPVDEYKFPDPETLVDFRTSSSSDVLAKQGKEVLENASKNADKMLKSRMEGQTGRGDRTVKDGDGNPKEAPFSISVRTLESIPIAPEDIQSLTENDLWESETFTNKISARISEHNTVLYGIVIVIIASAISLIIASIVLRNKETWVPSIKKSLLIGGSITLASLILTYIIRRMSKTEESNMSNTCEMNEQIGPIDSGE